MPFHCFSRRVEFADTDAAGVVHFTRLLAYVEEAEHDWMRWLGVVRIGDGIGWPRVGVEVRYHAPARFEDQLEIILDHLLLESRRLRYDFAIRRDAVVLCQGTMQIAQVRLGPDGSFISQELPPVLRESLRPSGTA